MEPLLFACPQRLFLRLLYIGKKRLILDGDQHVRLRQIHFEESHNRGIITIPIASILKPGIWDRLRLFARVGTHLIIRTHSKRKPSDPDKVHVQKEILNRQRSYLRFTSHERADNPVSNVKQRKHSRRNGDHPCSDCRPIRQQRINPKPHQRLTVQHPLRTHFIQFLRRIAYAYQTFVDYHRHGLPCQLTSHTQFRPEIEAPINPFATFTNILQQCSIKQFRQHLTERPLIRHRVFE